MAVVESYTIDFLALVPLQSVHYLLWVLLEHLLEHLLLEVLLELVICVPLLEGLILLMMVMLLLLTCWLIYSLKL